MKLRNLNVYNLKNEIVISNSIGLMKQEKTKDSFNTALRVSRATGSRLKVGESYYAVGIREDGLPTRSEMVQCKSLGSNANFEGILKFPDKPIESNALAASDADILIQYTNYSSTQFTRSTWGSNLQDGFGGLTNSPGPLLAANSGQQSIGASQILGALDEGPADIYLCWAAGINFGVWIHFNFQMFGIGPRPIWYVTTNGSAWALAGSDPADPYTWDSQALGYSVIGTPTSGHSSLTVSVVITNLR
jgi:hypothetical protein